MGSNLRPEYGPERKVNPVPRRLADITKAQQMLGFRATDRPRGGPHEAGCLVASGPGRGIIDAMRSVLLAVALVAAVTARGLADVPPGFEQTTVVGGLSLPAGLNFAPDGRLFVVEKTGGVRVVKNGSLLATPFLDVVQVEPEFTDFSDGGLLGVTFAPGFPNPAYVYLYYTYCKIPGAGSCDTLKNRLVRVTAGYQGNPDVADPTSQVILLDDIGADSGIHDAGWIGFGPIDGKLYVAVGDGGADATKAQDLGTLSGKILRLEADGSPAAGNPFEGVFGARPEVWALGLRNPWRCRFHPDGRLFCGDVGQASWEEVDVILPGRNFGWPTTEGDFSQSAHPEFTRPLYAYAHAIGSSITAGDFGSQTNFPGDYQQSFFFADYIKGWIKQALLAADGVTLVSVSDFATLVGGITDLVAGPDGALYYPSIVEGEIRRIGVTGSNQSPVAQVSATPTAGAPPLTVQFSSAGSSDPDGDPLTISWDFGDGSPTSNAVAPSHTYLAAGGYVATLTVSDGRLPTPGVDIEAVTITVGTPPEVTISAPVADAIYQGGQTIALAGSATDAEDGALPASALSWEIRFHHDTHYHLFLNGLMGSPQSFETFTIGETSANVSYRIILRATDSSGLVGEASLFILPRVVALGLDSSPSGLQLTLDGQPVTAPAQVASVAGVVRTIGTAQSQGTYTFNSWSDGGTLNHTISTPAVDTTYTALFDGATTTSTTSPDPTTTSTTTSTTIAPSTTSTTTSTAPVATTTTSTTLPPICPSGVTLDAVSCRIADLDSETDVFPAVQRRLDRALAGVQRASARCGKGQLRRARTALRAALRELKAAHARLGSGPNRSLPLQQRVAAVQADVKALRGELVCP